MIDSDELKDLIKEAVGFIATSARLSVFTGAGMSAESGIPTYRDENGLWMNHNPDDVATAAALHHDPERVWTFFRHNELL